MKIVKITALILALVLSAAFGAACGIREQNYEEGEYIEYTWFIPTQQLSPVTNSKIVKKLQSKFNIGFNITEVSTSDMTNKKNLALAGQDKYDLVSWITKEEAEDNGYYIFLDLAEKLSEMPNFKSYLDDTPEERSAVYSVDDKVYRLPSVNKEYLMSSLNFSILYAELKAIAAADQTEFPAGVKGKTADELITYMETWQGFYDTLLASKLMRPEAGSVRANYFPLNPAVKDFLDAFYFDFIFSFTKGVSPYFNIYEPAYDAEQDMYVNPFTVPGYEEAIAYLHKLYADGILNPGYSASSGLGVVVENIRDGKAAATYHYGGGMAGTYSAQKDIYEGHKDEPDAADYRLVPLKLPQTDGQQVLGVKSTVFAETGTCLSKDLKGEKLDRIIEALDWMYSQEAYDFLYWNPEVTKEENGTLVYADENIYKQAPSSVDIYLPWSICATFVTDFSVYYKPGNAYRDFLDGIITEENESKFIKFPAMAFTYDELEQLRVKQSNIKLYFESKIANLIKNNSYDSFIAGADEAAMNAILAIYNTANQRG